MRKVTDEGRVALENVAQRHGVSVDAVMTLLAALDHGNGRQAQFSHAELGGMGQWSQGGMIMVGDMFNNGLKYRVDQLCTELSSLMYSQPLFAPTPAHETMGGGGSWWPIECGAPSSTGSQNDMQYAVFPATRRLAIRIGDDIRVYDSGTHQIGGISQQQGGDIQNLTFTSQSGNIGLSDLRMISDTLSTPQSAVVGSAPVQKQGVEPDPLPPVAPASIPSAVPRPVVAASEDDIFGKIERLHALHTKGILSDVEFFAKKKELLDRI